MEVPERNWYPKFSVGKYCGHEEQVEQGEGSHPYFKLKSVHPQAIAIMQHTSTKK